MAQEIELKYAATQAQLTRLEAHFGEFTATRMESTYYDTPDRRLSAARITLRCRRENGRGICTVKTPGQGISRGEWECPGEDIHAALPVLCKLGGPALLLQLPRLQPLCGARFTRLSRLLSLPQATVELALDRGVLLGGDRELAFWEVELELKSGSQEALLAFGQTLSREFSLSGQPLSKFRRASLLATQAPGAAENP